MRGLIINRFSGNGSTDAFQLRTRGGNTIAGNWIGLDATGTSGAQNNSRAGIYLFNSAGNTIGGTAPADRNVILGGGNPALYDEGTGGGHTIQGNYVGTNAQGTASLGQNGIVLTTANNLIGGTASGAQNVISLSSRTGIQFNEGGATGNTVQGNYVGVAADGTTSLGSGSGIVIQRGSGNLIGGTAAAARNVIGGSQGVVVFGVSGVSSGNTVQGNYIGVNAAGTGLTSGTGNRITGVLLSSTTDNLVGGTEPGAGNVVAGFTDVGVRIFTSAPASTGNVVQGNRIGTNAAGTAALPNGTGVSLGSSSISLPTSGNTIGGTVPGAGNVISGNAGDGVYLSTDGTAVGTGNTIQGNYIGVAADGTTPLGNGQHGIEIGQGSGNVIGGTAAGAGNVIAYNGVPAGRYGVVVFSGTGNAIVGNAVYGNGRIGINLFVSGDAGNGVTPNDPGDADSGPNNLQNTPEIVGSTLAGGQLTVTYRVDTDPANAAYPLRVELFRADASGEGGEALLGTGTYTTADHGGCGTPPCPKTVTLTPAAAVLPTDALVATATDADGNTSEFTGTPHGVPAEPGAEPPATTALYAPAPNPTAGPPVRLAVYDVLGREVARLVDGEQAAGPHVDALDVERLAAGVYVVRLEAGGQVQTQRLTLVR